MELLVLPEEPTSSVLKEDWQREVAAQEQAEEDLVSLGGFDDIGVFGGSSKTGGMDGSGQCISDRGETSLKASSRVDIWAKRASLMFSATLVTASLIGAVQTVHRIPDEREQFWGWLSVVVGAVCLWPLSMFVLNVVSTCQRLGQLPTEKSGIILKCDTNAQAGMVIGETEHYQQHQDPDMANARYLDRVNHPDVFNHLATPRQGNSSGDNPPANALEQRINSEADDSACYFVKLPGTNDETRKNMDDSSISTISANSHLTRDGRFSNISA